jgi:hypothetical protein
MAYSSQQSGSDPSGNNQVTPISGQAPNGMSNATLAANASFVVDWFDTSGYTSLYYLMNSDKAGTLTLDWSQDKTVLITPSIVVQYDAQFAGLYPRVGAFAPRAKFARLTFKNGSTAQTYFQFAASLLTNNAQPSLETLLDSLADTRLAMVVKAAIQAKDTTGAYDFLYRTGNALNVNVTNADYSKDATLTNGNQKTQVTNFPATQAVSGNVGVNNFPTTYQVINPASGTPLTVTTNPTTTGGYPSKGYYQPSGTGGGYALIASGVRKLGGITITNTNSSAITIMLYDKATVPTSSDTAVQAYSIPANMVVPIDLGDGIHFNNGIGIGAAVGTNLLNIVSLLLTSISAGSITVSYNYI